MNIEAGVQQCLVEGCSNLRFSWSDLCKEHNDKVVLPGGICVTPELFADEQAFSAFIVQELREMLARYPVVAVRLLRVEEAGVS